MTDNPRTQLRLTALWALNEAAVGGIMHLVGSPFTGVFVGGGAVLLIALLAYFSKNNSAAILKALMVVLLIKGAIAPHSPITAYFAVAFQGLAGAFLFRFLPNFRLAALLLGFLALTESALQKLLTMTLLFGMSFWDALDKFVAYTLSKFPILGHFNTADGSLWVAGAFVGFYALCGLLIGWFAGSLPKEVEAALNTIDRPELEEIAQKTEKKSKKWHQNKLLRMAFFITLLFSAVYFLMPESRDQFQWLWLVGRTAAVLLLWFFLVNPLMLWLLHRFLNRKSGQYQQDVQSAMELLPAFRQYARLAWKTSENYKGLGRLRRFLVLLVGYCLI